MNENATKARIKSKTGIDCVIAWLEPRDEDDFHRKVKVSAVRQHPPVGNGFWEITIELDDEKLGDMSLYREGITYTRKICRALACAVGNQALHAARNRKNRKARRDKDLRVESGGWIMQDDIDMTAGVEHYRFMAERIAKMDGKALASVFKETTGMELVARIEEGGAE